MTDVDKSILEEFNSLFAADAVEAEKIVNEFSKSAKEAIKKGENKIKNNGINHKLSGYIITDVTPEGY